MNYLGAKPTRYQCKTTTIYSNMKFILGCHPSPEWMPAAKWAHLSFPTQRVGELNHLWILRTLCSSH